MVLPVDATVEAPRIAGLEIVDALVDIETFRQADGVAMNGGAVRPKFRGRGVYYRALVAARIEIARRAEVAGLAVWGGDMSRPILERLGFQAVGGRRFYVDATTA